MKTRMLSLISILLIVIMSLSNMATADSLPKKESHHFSILSNWAKSPYAHVLTKFVKSDHFQTNSEWLKYPYIRLDTGWSKLIDTDIPISRGVPVAIIYKKVKSDFKQVIGIGVGVYLDKIRADLTFNRHMKPVFKGSNTNTIKRQPLIDTYFLNVYWDLDVENNKTIFTPYMGVGMGVALVKDKVKNVAGTKALMHRKINFARRCIIGTTVDVTDNIQVDLSYIYHHYGKSRSKVIDNQQYGGATFQGHMITTGMRIGL